VEEEAAVQPMSEALDRILDDKRAFSDGVARCRATPFNVADSEDAYNRLSRLRDRTRKETPNLELSEREALDKVFVHDPFIKCLLEFRQVGEHVQYRQGVVLRTPTNNQPRYLDVKTTARTAFTAPLVRPPFTSGNLQLIDHLVYLEVAEKRVQNALDRATKKLH
jgi:hypothetical protein